MQIYSQDYIVKYLNKHVEAIDNLTREVNKLRYVNDILITNNTKLVRINSLISKKIRMYK